MSQKIVIPKGLINPNETTIIEIPEDIQNVETVIAKPFLVQTECAPYECNFEYEQYPTEPTVRYIEEDIEYSETLEEFNRPDYASCLQYPKRKVYKNHQQTYYMNPIYNNVNIPYNKKSWKNAGDMQKNQTNLLPKEYIPPNMLMRKPCMAKDILDAMDKAEFQKMQKNLKEYQAARRKLLYETTNLYSIDDVSKNLSKF